MFLTLDSDGKSAILHECTETSCPNFPWASNMSLTFDTFSFATATSERVDGISAAHSGGKKGDR